MAAKGIKRDARFECARFFQYLPDRTANSLDEVQRRDIAHTIFELQRSNPRILQELYLDNPYVSNEGDSALFRRIKRRFYLMVRTLWFTLLYSNAVESRRENRIADLLFMLVVSMPFFASILGFLFLIYTLKSAAGIDLAPGFHLFCSN